MKGSCPEMRSKSMKNEGLMSRDEMSRSMKNEGVMIHGKNGETSVEMVKKLYHPKEIVSPRMKLYHPE
eukprot:9509590-Karenia_brevis.AAC.1